MRDWSLKLDHRRVVSNHSRDETREIAEALFFSDFECYANLFGFYLTGKRVVLNLFKQ